MVPLTHSRNTHTHSKGHHSALTISLAEAGLTHTKRKRWEELHTKYTHTHNGDKWGPIL